jgi:hypothetical protein
MFSTAQNMPIKVAMKQKTRKIPAASKCLLKNTPIVSHKK